MIYNLSSMAGVDDTMTPRDTDKLLVHGRGRRIDYASFAWVAVVAEFAIIFLLWEVAVGVLELVSPVFLPTPSGIAAGMWNLAASGELWTHGTVSLAAWFAGYSLALVAGISIGSMVGSWLPAHRLLGPILWSFYAIPWLAYQPLSQAWFGFGLQPVIFLVFIASLFPILFNAAAGVSGADRSLLNAGRVFGATRLAIFRKIVLPAAMPFVFAGMRQSAVMATTALLVAEMTGPSVGIGQLIMFKTNRFVTAEAFAAIVITIIWTVALSELIAWAGHRLAPWQTDARRA